MKHFLSRVGRIALAVLAGVVIGNPILLYFIQEKLIFFPQPINEGNRALIRERYPAVSEVNLVGADGNKLHGWFQRARGLEKAPLLIYFGGNGEDISFMPSKRDLVEGWSLLAVDYRGYGLSEGAPGEKAIFADALAIHDAFIRRDDVDAGRVAVMGRSLGSGVATYLAANRPVKAVVLVTPYDSVANVAKEKFWFVPVSLLLKHRFDSVALAPKISQPALFIVASEDVTIPPVHARRLFDAWAGPKTWRLVKGETHDTVEFDPDYWKAIGEFLGAVRP